MWTILSCVHHSIQFNTAACLLVYNVLYSLSVSHQVASVQQGRRCDLLTSCHTWANNTMLWMYNLTTIGTRCLQIETILSKQQEQEQSKNWKRVLDTIMLLCPALRFVFLRWHNMIARGGRIWACTFYSRPNYKWQHHTSPPFRIDPSKGFEKDFASNPYLSSEARVKPTAAE